MIAQKIIWSPQRRCLNCQAQICKGSGICQGTRLSAQDTSRRGGVVLAVQRMVKHSNLPNTSITLDGDYGPATEAAIKSWQGYFGLTQDGIVGPQTWDTFWPYLDDIVQSNPVDQIYNWNCGSGTTSTQPAIPGAVNGDIGFTWYNGVNQNNQWIFQYFCNSRNAYMEIQMDNNHYTDYNNPTAGSTDCAPQSTY